MIGRARQLAARRTPYPALQAAYYAQHELFVHRRREAAALSAGLRSGPLLNRAFTRKSERVFILGSGSSINAISEARFREIAAADSFGFNLWVRHPFVPSLYTVELADFEENPAGRPVAKVIAEWLDRRPEYRSVPLVFSDYAPTRRECLNMYPRWVQESAFSLNTIPAIARSADELGRCLSTLDRVGIFAADSQLRRVFKYRATVSMLISLAVALGYREIVLCGIDIDDPRYFYEDETRYPDMKRFRSSPRRARHATAYASPMQVSVMDVIHGLNRRVLQPRGIRLSVEHASSALHPRLPVYSSAVSSGA